MIKLQNKYSGKSALFIPGGPSILENKYDLTQLSKKDHIIFLESRALTPKFLENGIEPNYLMMPFPEKARTNTLQQMFLCAISCGYDLGKCLNEIYLDDWINFKKYFPDNVKIWKITYPHKRYRIKENVILEDSPISLIEKLPNMDIITNDSEYKIDGFHKLNIQNKVYKYIHNQEFASNLKEYFRPKIIDGEVSVVKHSTTNSAAIALYPILNYMGFNKVYFLGMDMSMLGQFEYSSLYTFKTLNHYSKFFNYARNTFSYQFPLGIIKGSLSFAKTFYNDAKKLNIVELIAYDKFRKLHHDWFGLQGKYMRPKQELQDCSLIFRYPEIKFINIYEPFKYATQLLGADNITYNEYINGE